MVVLADKHNCSILHPNFLKSEEIVPPEWDLAEPSVSTPVFASVKFQNDIVFVVDEHKFQVVIENPTEDTFFRNVSLAEKYIKTLPYVRYHATGYNIHGFMEQSEPEQYLNSKFLKKGFWNSDDNVLDGAGIKLVYQKDNTRIRYQIDTGLLKKDTPEEKKGIIINANFHTDIHNNQDKDTRLEELTNTFKKVEEYKIELLNFLKNTFDV